MSDRIEREIDELLARLGFDEAARTEPVPVSTTGRPGSRRIFPGSPVRLMLAGFFLLLAGLVLPMGVSRLLILVGATVFCLAYLTWLFEPDPTPDGAEPSWFARFYRRIYGE